MGDEYDGEYKVVIKDKGNISFNLNIKWVISILISIFGIIGYLVIDKYHTQPITQLKIENTELKNSDINTAERLDKLQMDIKSLLDRSDRAEKFINIWLSKNINQDSTAHILNAENDRVPGQ